MFKFKELEKFEKPYAENNQVNKMRWELLYRNADGTFDVLTNRFKCREFFNDIVLALHGCFYNVYDFNNDRKYNEDAVWVRLTSVNSEETFFHNWNIIITRMAKDGLDTPTLYPLGRNAFVVRFPKSLFSHTYYISLVTFLIRSSAYGYAFNSVEDMVTDQKSPAFKLEYGASRAIIAAKILFNLPERAKERPWFSKSLGDKLDPNLMYNYHNNGFMDVAGHLELTK